MDTLLLNADGMPMSLFPVSAWAWQDAIKLIWKEKVTVVEHYDDWIVRSPSLEMRVPCIVMAKKQVKIRRSIRLSSENLFLRDGHRCQYCTQRFPEDLLTWDHVIPQSRGGGSSWKNLVSACSPCNNKRGNNQSIQPKIAPYQPTYYEMLEKRRQYPIYIPHESWFPYLGWDEENVVLRKRKAPAISLKAA
jgi:5-methylcytosine-specific restriction endonuclease McrA